MKYMSLDVQQTTINQLIILMYMKHKLFSSIRRAFTPGFVNYKKGLTRIAAASDKVYQLLAHSRWFSPGTTTFSITKTGRHDTAEILLKMALNTKNKNINITNYSTPRCLIAQSKWWCHQSTSDTAVWSASLNIEPNHADEITIVTGSTWFNNAIKSCIH